MSEIKILPCPFCGETERLSVTTCGSLTSDMPSRPYRVVCRYIDHDSVEGPVAYGTHDAIVAWNRRATLSSATVAEVFVDGKRLYNITYPADALDKLPKGAALYLDPPPTSELEAEIARLKTELDCALIREGNEKHHAKIAHQNMNAEINARERAEARLAEALKALDDMDSRYRSGANADTLVLIARKAARRVREGGKVDG